MSFKGGPRDPKYRKMLMQTMEGEDAARYKQFLLRKQAMHEAALKNA